MHWKMSSLENKFKLPHPKENKPYESKESKHEIRTNCRGKKGQGGWGPSPGNTWVIPENIIFQKEFYIVMFWPGIIIQYITYNVKRQLAAKSSLKWRPWIISLPSKTFRFFKLLTTMCCKPGTFSYIISFSLIWFSQQPYILIIIFQMRRQRESLCRIFIPLRSWKPLYFLKHS